MAKVVLTKKFYITQNEDFFMPKHSTTKLELISLPA